VPATPAGAGAVEVVVAGGAVVVVDGAGLVVAVVAAVVGVVDAVVPSVVSGVEPSGATTASEESATSPVTGGVQAASPSVAIAAINSQRLRDMSAPVGPVVPNPSFLLSAGLRGT
jgi:hypothetical protein